MEEIDWLRVVIDHILDVLDKLAPWIPPRAGPGGELEARLHPWPAVTSNVPPHEVSECIVRSNALYRDGRKIPVFGISKCSFFSTPVGSGQFKKRY